MPRTLTGDVIAELTAKTLCPILFAEIAFVSGPSYFWTGAGTINWNGHDWVGVGRCGSVSEMEESDEIRATNLVLTLSGIPSDLVGAALTECRNGKPVTIWFGQLTENGTVVASPAKAWSGMMDVPTIDEGGETSTVTLNVESRLARLQDPNIHRYTTQDQQPISPGDLGFVYVEVIQDWTGAWGKGAGPSSAALRPSAGFRGVGTPSRGVSGR